MEVTLPVSTVPEPGVGLEDQPGVPLLLGHQSVDVQPPSGGISCSIDINCGKRKIAVQCGFCCATGGDPIPLLVQKTNLGHFGFFWSFVRHKLLRWSLILLCFP